MRAIILVCAIVLVSGTASAQSLAGMERGIQFAQVGIQVISCGTKDGKRKEYPTPEAARADGATDIRPKTGPTCEATQ